MTAGNVKIRPLAPGDWASVKAIYLEGIATGQATFETGAPDWDEWNANHHQFARIVANAGNESSVVGWAALSPVSKRSAYAGVAEVSVYVAAEHRAEGVGTQLLQRLIDESEEHGIWTLQASAYPENHASIALHFGCGFTKVGVRKRIAKLNGAWRNTVLLERRSQKID